MNKTVDNTPETPWTPQNPVMQRDTATVKAIDPIQATIPRPPRKLTLKQQAFIKQLIENPKQSATQAVARVYNVSTRHTAEVIASENLRKPEILAELAKHSGNAEMVILEVLEQSKKKMYDDSPKAVDWAVNARQTADSLLDRIHGKSKQTIESHNTTVTLSLNLSDITDIEK